MKYVAYGLMAAFLAAAVYGAIPDTAAGWYTPDKFSIEVTSGVLEVQTTDEYGNTDTIEYPVYVDETGYVVGMDGTDLTEVVLDSVSYKALQAFVLAERNKERIETIGDNLNDLMSIGGININNSTKGESYTIKFTGGTLANTLNNYKTDIPATSDEEDSADKKSIDWTNDNKLEIKGWGSASPDAGDTVADVLTNGTGYVNNPARSWSLVARSSSGNLRYMAFGRLRESISEPPAVDGKSVTTNTTDGAVSQGEISLHGYATASDWAIPYKNGEGSGGTLEWKTPDEWCGDSLDWGSVGSGKKLDVIGANDYAGKHSRHYFGTSNDKSATLGWHELPNVTTNRVEGDGVTIASTVDDQDPGLKRLGLRGWNKSWGGDPLFVVNAGGSIGYMPLPALTNLAACACTQKWENAVAWIGGDAAFDEDGGLTLPDDSLDEYMYNTLGYIYSTTPGNLHFDNDGTQVEASFSAPANWADGDSVELTDEGAYQVAGWADASACEASMSAMLSDPTGSDATTHLMLAKKTDTGELHYVAIGDGVKSGAEVDDTTITTNTAYGAVTSGVASIRGWGSAANDTYLSKNEGGNLEWRKVDPVPGVDGESVVTNTAKELTLNGYAAADVGAVPQKTEQGLSWLKASSATNLILAGAGINITDNGGGAITISAQSLDGEDSGSGASQTVTVVTDVRYDEASHKFQKKTRQLVFKGSLGTESGWTDVFYAVPHSDEHTEE